MRKFISEMLVIAMATMSVLYLIDLFKKPETDFAYSYELRYDSAPIDRNNLIARFQNAMIWAATYEQPENRGYAGVMPGMGGSVKLFWKGEPSYFAEAVISSYPQVKVEVVQAEYSAFELHQQRLRIDLQTEMIEKYELMNVKEAADGAGLTVYTYLDRTDELSRDLVKSLSSVVDVPLTFVFADRNFELLDIRNV